MNSVTTDTQQATVPSKTAPAQELDVLRAIQQTSQTLGTILDLKPLIKATAPFIQELSGCHHCLIMMNDPESYALGFGTLVPALEHKNEQNDLRSAYINVYNGEDDPVIGQWLVGKPIAIDNQTASQSRVAGFLQFESFDNLYSFPFYSHEKFIGVMVLNYQGTSIDSTKISLLQAVTDTISITLENALKHNQTVRQLADNMTELNILRQIDEELKDTIELRRVFKMILDWALRFTNAHASALALYDVDKDTLRVMEHYGYDLNNSLLKVIEEDHTGGITHRVARFGQVEVIPDVAMDKDYVAINPKIRSQLSVPIMREDRVVAVLTLESEKVNAFDDGHLSFIDVLSQRAGVAVDNARLFTETRWEQEKLALILESIKDSVIVVSPEQRIVLINPSALSALQLYNNADRYIGQRFQDVVDDQEIKEFFYKALETDQGSIAEFELPNGNFYYANIAKQAGVGWIIIMQDITPFKETDKLKSELLATASHDLKQPLSVMRGYVDLLNMTNEFDERSTRFMDSLQLAIRNMQRLIDELLDLAKIESGLQLEIESVDLTAVLNDCVSVVKSKAEEKSLKINLEVPPDLPEVQGDRFRLGQIFNNLVGNAVKYTPASGRVNIYAEKRGLVLRISVQDTGIGISPEDRAHIFDRFYRVRRPETDGIEGTGLGLAIVKSLIEAHQGKIDLESKLNHGSTFHVTLPIG